MNKSYSTKFGVAAAVLLASPFGSSTANAFTIVRGTGAYASCHFINDSDTNLRVLSHGGSMNVGPCPGMIPGSTHIPTNDPNVIRFETAKSTCLMNRVSGREFALDTSTCHFKTGAGTARPRQLQGYNGTAGKVATYGYGAN